MMLSRFVHAFGTLRSFSATTSTMKKSKKPVESEKSNEIDESAIFAEKNGQIVLRIHATPGSKKSAITTMDENAINVSLAARPVDGQANKELLEFMTSALGLRKTELDFRKGAKSRSKILVIESDRVNIDEVRRRIEEQINS